MKKKNYFVEYYDTKRKICNTFIKATSELEVEMKFYELYPYYLIRKISLL